MHILLRFVPFDQEASSFHSERFSARSILLLRCVGLLVATLLATTSDVVAQQNFQGDALVQRLPDASAYIEVQTKWTSNVSTVVRQLDNHCPGSQEWRDRILCQGQSLGETSFRGPTDLEHVHVRRLSVPDGPVRIEWSVNVGEKPLWLHNMNVRVPIGGVPEFSDAILVSTHAKASQRSHPDMVHSGLEMIPVVGRSIPTNALAASFYVELHGIAEIVGQDSLFLLAYGWANSSGEWEPSATAYARKSASQIVPILKPFPVLPPSLWATVLC